MGGFAEETNASVLSTDKKPTKKRSTVEVNFGVQNEGMMPVGKETDQNAG